MDILVKYRNDDRKMMQSIRILSGPFSKIRKYNQLIQFRSTKVIPTENGYAGNILTMSQEFKRGSK